MGLTDPHLRWYLDYCCRDDYGAGIATVSAWAGIHYFASRHGFHAAPGRSTASARACSPGPKAMPGSPAAWPHPWASACTPGVVLRIASTKHGVEVDAFNTATQARWSAGRPARMVALPVFVARGWCKTRPTFCARPPPHRVRALAGGQHPHQSALHDRPGAPPSWDNVLSMA
jgi:hypothetical protein